METYPVFLKMAGRRVIFSGAGDHAAAKIKLLLKTTATIVVYGDDVCADVARWAEEGRITLHRRAVHACDMAGAALVYGANDDEAEDARAAFAARKQGILANIVDNLEGSDFLTGALVDRDPVTIAIGTEGTAPVLARRIKADIEAMLPQSTGVLARMANGFRPVAARLAPGRARRAFWARFFESDGPAAHEQGGERAVRKALLTGFTTALSAKREDGSVALVGAGPGDPDLLTRKAAKVLHEADVVLHDALVTPEILELARREAKIVNVGKRGFGPSWKQADIEDLMIAEAAAGHRVVRLKAGDTAVFARLDEEVETLERAGIACEIVPGITAATAAAATLGRSLTRRGRNSELRIVTGHDVDGFADHDWQALAKPGATAAIYMGLKAARFLSGRMLMHGAEAATPVTVVENASRADQRILASTLNDLAADLDAAALTGPAVILLGIAPRDAAAIDLSTRTADTAVAAALVREA